MTIRKATLGACLLISCSAFGARTYKTKPGDTVAGVADKLGVSQKALIQANDLGNRKKLKAGKVLTVPSSSKAHHEVSLHKSAGSYVIHNGDCDWTVAHRFGLTVPQLKALNPGVDLSNLTIGHSLHVPGHGGSSAVASKSEHKSVHASATYTVREDDNDWIIAKNVGISTKVLRELNPSVKWGSIQPGQKLRIPGSGSSAVASRFPVIHTRHAFIAKDDVVLRRGPSTESELIVTVDSGVPVTVIDREGNWYKLHFPKGTEAWVRGDNLKPASTQVAEHHHHSSAVASRESTHSSSKRSARIAYLQHLERLARQQAHSKNVAMRNKARHDLAKIHEARVAEHLPATSDDLVADARGYLGTPYNWGSASRGATDCSGLMLQIMRRHGVKLPRTSLEQSHTGQSVSKGELKEGDLVFFRTRGSGRVSHVGMYVGNGNFIHASSGGGEVMVSSLSDGYYSKRFAGAKRVIKHKAAVKPTPKADVVKAKDEDGDNDKPTDSPTKE